MKTQGLTSLCLALLLSACTRSDPVRGAAKQQTPAPVAGSPQQIARPDTSKSALWVERSRTWPDTLLWVFDSAGEHVQDGLLMRLRLDASQNLIPGYYKGTKPLECQMYMTMKPIPAWPVARGLVVDSVVFDDPIRHVKLQGLPLLSSQRSMDGQTLRMTFSTNMARPYTPIVTEGQPLDPTVYMHWNKRQVVAKLRPVPVKFRRSEES